MNIINKDFKLCFSCMEEHEVLTVEVEEKGTFKGEKLAFNAIYEYCTN